MRYIIYYENEEITNEEKAQTKKSHMKKSQTKKTKHCNDKILCTMCHSKYLCNTNKT